MNALFRSYDESKRNCDVFATFTYWYSILDSCFLCSIIGCSKDWLLTRFPALLYFGGSNSRQRLFFWPSNKFNCLAPPLVEEVTYNLVISHKIRAAPINICWSSKTVSLSTVAWLLPIYIYIYIHETTLLLL